MDNGGIEKTGEESKMNDVEGTLAGFVGKFRVSFGFLLNVGARIISLTKKIVPVFRLNKWSGGDGLYLVAGTTIKLLTD